jgi:hypothetical protein
LILIIVIFNDFFETFDVFDERLPFSVSFFKLFFYGDLFVMKKMFFAEDNTIHAVKFLSMVFASFYIAIEGLNVITATVALFIVIGNPFIEN